MHSARTRHGAQRFCPPIRTPLLAGSMSGVDEWPTRRGACAEDWCRGLVPGLSGQAGSAPRCGVKDYGVTSGGERIGQVSSNDTGGSAVAAKEGPRAQCGAAARFHVRKERRLGQQAKSLTISPRSPRTSILTAKIIAVSRHTGQTNGTSFGRLRHRRGLHSHGPVVTRRAIGCERQGFCSSAIKARSTFSKAVKRSDAEV